MLKYYENISVGEPVFLTKNGRGRYVIIDIEDCENKCNNKITERAIKKGKIR